ncbi:MAG: mechanosensitive ion channel domain-containing protein [Elusimicrobiota bacterium]
MRKAKVLLAVPLCVLLAVPAPTQMRAAVPIISRSVPRVVCAPPALSAGLMPGVSLNAASLPAPGLVPDASVVPVLPHAPVAARPVAAPVARAAALASASEALPVARGAALPVSAEAERASSESFWSGASRREDPAVAASKPEASPARRPWAARLKAFVAVPAVIPSMVPAASGLKALLVQAVPFLEAGAVLAGAYAANRLARWIIGKVAKKKGLDRHQIAVTRLVVSVALWSAAAAGALTLGGAPASAVTAVFGAGGTLITLALRDILGNLIHGVNFLIPRPYTVGDRVQIDDSVGTVADLTLNGMRVAKDDGADVKVRYATLAAKPVILLGTYQFPDASLNSSSGPRLLGGIRAVWTSLDYGVFLAATIFAGLLFAPGLFAVAATGWTASLLGYATAGAAAWLTRRVELVLVKAVEKIADSNSWRLESRVIARLAVRAAVWAIGGGAVLRASGVSWTALAASLGLTTLGIGLASNNFFSTVVQGGEVLFAKPFKVGDRLKVGAFEGVVEDMTLYHVVIKLGEGRHALLPYAVVRDAAIVVHPGNTPK